MSGDRTLTIVQEGGRRSRALAHADALNRSGHADGTLVERGRARRGEPGTADRIVDGTLRRAVKQVVPDLCWGG